MKKCEYDNLMLCTAAIMYRGVTRGPMFSSLINFSSSSLRMSCWSSTERTFLPLLCQCEKLCSLFNTSQRTEYFLKFNSLHVRLNTYRSYSSLHGSQHFTSAQAANQFVSLLLPDEREALRQALETYQQEESKIQGVFNISVQI